MLSPGNMQTICRYATASQKYAVVGEWSWSRTLGRWTGAVAELLEPLYDVLRQYVLMPGKVHAEISPSRSRTGSGKTRTARLWVYVRDDRNAGSQMPRRSGSAYSPDRKVSIHKIRPVTAVCASGRCFTVVTGRYTNPAE